MLSCGLHSILLTEYKASSDVVPSRWVFPSRTQDDYHVVLVKNPKENVPSAHHCRHSYRNALVELGASGDEPRLLLGHSLGSDVSSNYITASLLVESLRPITNAVADHYTRILGDLS